MKKRWVSLAVASMLVLGGCGSADKAEPAGHQDHGAMDHSSSGELPPGLQEAVAPAFPVGSQAVIHAEHMPGMDGALATVAGAYETTVYSISYTPTTGGEAVSEHKWIIHEEIADPSQESYTPGSEVTLDADHMQGMDGATATVDTAERTTVYMVDYEQTTDGAAVRNHKWVTEAELASP